MISGRTGAVLLSSGVALAMTFGVALADEPTIHIGMLSIHTGVGASVGAQMENGFRELLKERNGELGGVKVDLTIVDTSGSPATALAKAQELVERDKVDIVVGPVASTEALAIQGYMRDAKVPLVSSSAIAEDQTQRKASPWFVRATSSTGQLSQPFGEYAAKTLHYHRVATIATDFAYGQEVVAGFQRTFEENGGEVVQKIWVPNNVTDFSSYILQIGKVDAVYASFSGPAAQNFLRAYAEYGYKNKYPLLTSHSVVDENLLPETGSDAVGIISSAFYTATLDNPDNQKFVKEYTHDFGVAPGFYSSGGYTAALIIEDALKRVGTNFSNKDALMAALRSTHLTHSPRGEITLDEYGNPICDIQIRKVEMKDGKPQNTIIKVYPKVSQFWTYKPSEFLANPVYSRDFPVSANLGK